VRDWKWGDGKEGGGRGDSMDKGWGGGGGKGWGVGGEGSRGGEGRDYVWGRRGGGSGVRWRGRRRKVVLFLIHLVQLGGEVSVGVPVVA